MLISLSSMADFMRLNFRLLLGVSWLLFVNTWNGSLPCVWWKWPVSLAGQHWRSLELSMGDTVVCKHLENLFGEWEEMAGDRWSVAWQTKMRRQAPTAAAESIRSQLVRQRPASLCTTNIPMDSCKYHWSPSTNRMAKMKSIILVVVKAGTN